MSENPSDADIKADIPQDAIDAAMKSVETPVVEEAEKPLESERVRKLEAMLNDSVARAATTQERLKETHERYMRTAADFENWKKRSAREREDVVKFGNEKLLKDIIPVVDNLERAVSSGDSGTLLEGVRLVLKQFTDVLARFGVKSFISVGETFDPAKHEALMQAESDFPPNTVVSEMAKGYLLNDRLVRPAAVVVSKGRSAAPPPSDSTNSASNGVVA